MPAFALRASAGVVGMPGFEPGAPRPPDVYSNRTELHPVIQIALLHTLAGCSEVLVPK